MNKKRIILSTAMFAAVVFGAIASAQSIEPFSPYSAISPSVEVWQMTKAGNLKPSLYTGTMTYSLPLYTYSDSDFNIPVTLSYSFDGFRPAQNSGTVGYGWYLDFGGVITREVRGLPDEDASLNGTGRNLYGYWYSTRRTNQNDDRYSIVSERFGDYERWGTFASSMGAGHITREAALELNPFISTPTQLSFSYTFLPGTYAYYPFYTSINPSHYDMTPDIYHFSFLGHQGDFMLEPDGSVRVFNSDIPHGELSVEFDMSNMTPHGGQDIHLSGFVFTDGEGYKYYFGMSHPTMEIGASEHFPMSALSPIPLCVTAWHLRRIEAPNGRFAEFVYSYDKQITRTSAPYYPVEKTGTGIHTYEAPSNIHSYSLLSVPEGLEIDGHRVIAMNYSDKNPDESSSDYFDDYPRNLTVTNTPFGYSATSLRLSSINVINKVGQTVENISLCQSYADEGTPKMFLTSVSSFRNGAHHFSYNDENVTFPKNDTQSTDHWGYWNGNLPRDLRQICRSGTSRYNQMTSDSKDPDCDYSIAGALRKITYPTGGHTSVTYEGNVVERGLDEEGMIYYPSGDIMPVGGVRVSSMTDCTCASDSGTTTSYTYADGFLYHMPRYVISLPIEFRFQELTPTYDESGNPTTTIRTSVLSYHATGYFPDCDYSVSRDCIHGYGHVSIEYPDNSRVDNYFADYSGNTSDVYNEDNLYFTFSKRGSFSHMDNFDIGLENYLPPVIAVPVSDRKNMRGKPLRTEVRNASGEMVRKTEFEYTPDVVSLGHIYYNNLDSYVCNPWECHSPVLAVRKDTFYEGGSGQTTVSELYYNTLGQVTSKREVAVSAADTLMTYFRYLHEDDSMALKGLLSDAVRTRSENGTEKVVDSEHYEYASPAVHGKPSSVTVYDIQAPYSASALTLFTAGRNGESRQTWFSYDDSLRVTDVILPGRDSLHYKWDGSNVVAKTYGGRNSGNTSLYEWKDLVGLTKSTDPSGTSESYIYDNRNRLRLVKDADDRSVMVYDYRIKNEQ